MLIFEGLFPHLYMSTGLKRCMCSYSSTCQMYSVVTSMLMSVQVRRKKWVSLKFAKNSFGTTDEQRLFWFIQRNSWVMEFITNYYGRPSAHGNAFEVLVCVLEHMDMQLTGVRRERYLFFSCTCTVETSILLIFEYSSRALA